MVKKTDIDLIITTRNRAGELVKTLNLLNEKGFPLNQITIIDDASSDKTVEILQNKYSSVRVIVNENTQGLIHNRNTLIKNTNRPYILSLDDDSCFIETDDIIEAAQLLASKAEYGVFHFNTFEQIQPPPAKHLHSAKLSQYRTFIGCGHIIKRDILSLTGLYLEELFFYGEELDLSLKAYKLGIKVISQANLIVHHRIDHNKRKTQIKSDNNQGVYGYHWRLKMQLANNLLIIYLHYPKYISFFYMLFNIFSFYKKCKNPTIIRESIKTYRINKCKLKSHRQPMDLSTFHNWKKLPSY